MTTVSPIMFGDLEIRIGKKQDAGYPIELTLNHEQQFNSGHLAKSILPWVPSASPEADGQRLFDSLFADPELAKDWAKIRGQSPQVRLRLRIDQAAAELYQVPWELLRDVSGAIPLQLAAQDATPFSRYLTGESLPGSPIIKRPIKMLVAVAAPDDLSDYGFDADKDQIDPNEEWELLRQVTSEIDALEVELLPQPCTLPAITSKLKEGFHILHLISHGKFIDDDDASEALLYLATDDNNVELVNRQKFAEMLAQQLHDIAAQREDKLRLVFLSSCQTAVHDSGDGFRSFAPALVAAGVPAVIAMQDNVPVDTARTFAQVFYRQLMHHGLVDLAANEARGEAIAAELPGTAIPVVYSRLTNGRLLGQRGQLSSDRQEEGFWPVLLENIERGKCIPFLGPRVTQGLLPSPNSVALKLAEKYNYPLADRHNLAKVAQFIALRDPELLREDYIKLLRRSLFDYLDIKPTAEHKKKFKDANLSDTAAGLKWADTILALRENEIHHLLADLPLPLYLTTNVDSFMTNALQHAGRSPRRLGLRWEKVEAGTPQFTLPKALDMDSPVVLHLNGYDADPAQQANLILSEESYLEHFIRMTREQDVRLPAQVNTALSESSFLFLGYDLNDWEFRVVIQGLIRTIEQRRRREDRKLHVGVQLETQSRSR